jgi:fructosamine-3-kinase
MVELATFFLCSSRIGPEMFEGEALGLKAMYETKSIRVPLPYKVREVASNAGTCTTANVWTYQQNQ